MLKKFHLEFHIILLQITDSLWRVVVSSVFSDFTTKYFVDTLLK
jgi:hypothetical protein